LVEQYEALCEFDRREIALITPMRAMRQLHQCGWLASRWDDPAFPMHFTWFNTPRYWGEQVNNLRQLEHELTLPSISLMG
jgi:Ser/Thr protein kinase RdoA (MazF antagonist)